MNQPQKTVKRKPTRCIVPSCFYNKPTPPLSSKDAAPNPPNWSEISGETKLFFNPIIQAQYNTSLEQVKFMVCENHSNYHDLIKDFENRLEKAPVSQDFVELVGKVNQETLKNYDIIKVLNGSFELLRRHVNGFSAKEVDRQGQDEVEFLIKLLEFLKIVTRSAENRSMLFEVGIVEFLVKIIEKNELKSSQDSENKVKVVALSIFVLTTFFTLDEHRFGDLPQRAYKATWSYLSMSVPELQHQTLALLWALLNYKDVSFKNNLKKQTLFLIKKFNEYKENWSTKTLELAIMFLASLVFNEKRQLLIDIGESDMGQLQECLEYVEDVEGSLSERGKYFSERLATYLQLFVQRRELKVPE